MLPRQATEISRCPPHPLNTESLGIQEEIFHFITHHWIHIKTSACSNNAFLHLQIAIIGTGGKTNSKTLKAAINIIDATLNEMEEAGERQINYSHHYCSHVHYFLCVRVSHFMSSRFILYALSAAITRLVLNYWSLISCFFMDLEHPIPWQKKVPWLWVQ